MENINCKSDGDMFKVVFNTDKCEINRAEEPCRKCANQQKFHIFIIGFLLLTVMMNAVLLTNQISNSYRMKSMTDSIDSLQRQVNKVASTRTQHTVLNTAAVEVNQESHWVSDTNPFQSQRISPANQKRIKRKAQRKKKRKGYVHIEGTGGQHSPEGIFSKWQLADWTVPLKVKPGIVRTGGNDFHLNLGSGELTIKKQGIYLFYSQITLMGQPDQGYFVERNNEKIASCFLTFPNSALTGDNSHDHNMSCSTTGIFAFGAKDKLRIRHYKREGVMAQFDSNASYFGLVRLK